MTTDQLKKGEILVEIINTTKKAYVRLSNHLKDSEKERLDNEYDDGCYSIHIAQYKDDMDGEMNRYGGNKELLEVIVKTLKEQLDRYTKEFEEL